MTRFKTLLATALMSAAPFSYALDINGLENLIDPLDAEKTQNDFDDLTADLGAALSYKALSPAEPLGVIGFDIGVEASSTSLNKADTFKKATGEDYSSLVVPRIHAHKGLPLGFDIGASLAKAGDLSLLGLELKYAILDGGVITPSVAVRATYSRLSGLSDLDLNTMGLELAVSKGFLMLTPYAGAGFVQVTATPNVSGLKESSQNLTKLFVGTNFNLAILNLALEADQTGDATSINAKVGLRF